MSSRNVWLSILLLSITWETSFLFIKIALDDLHPATLVALRLTVGMLTLLIVTRWRKLSLPRQWAPEELFVLRQCPVCHIVTDLRAGFIPIGCR